MDLGLTSIVHLNVAGKIVVSVSTKDIVTLIRLVVTNLDLVRQKRYRKAIHRVLAVH